jgi:osmotically-inducible protein OsmY
MSQSATIRKRQHTAQPTDVPSANARYLTPSHEDRLLAERVQAALRASGYRALKGIRVSVRTQVVSLKGRVFSYHLKQLAQETALAVQGAHQIRNDLDVVQPR